MQRCFRCPFEASQAEPGLAGLHRRQPRAASRGSCGLPPEATAPARPCPGSGNTAFVSREIKNSCCPSITHSPVTTGTRNTERGTFNPASEPEGAGGTHRERGQRQDRAPTTPVPFSQDAGSLGRLFCEGHRAGVTEPWMDAPCHWSLSKVWESKTRSRVPWLPQDVPGLVTMVACGLSSGPRWTCAATCTRPWAFQPLPVSRGALPAQPG